LSAIDQNRSEIAANTGHFPNLHSWRSGQRTLYTWLLRLATTATPIFPAWWPFVFSQFAAQALRLRPEHFAVFAEERDGSGGSLLHLSILRHNAIADAGHKSIFIGEFEGGAIGANAHAKLYIGPLAGEGELWSRILQDAQRYRSVMLGIGEQ
jgi:hypothetical protein